MSSSTRRRSSLLLELGRAQSKIATLEDFIRDRERQFRATVVNLERQDSLQSAMMRTRRAGLSHDMFRIRSMSHEEQDEIDDETLSKPLAEYISLTISRVVCGSDESHEPVPFILRRLVSRQYHVGPEGAVIGSSPEANVSLPQDAGLWDKHVEIKWISDVCSGKRERDCGYFLLRDLTHGRGVFYISKPESNRQYSVIHEEKSCNICEVPSLSSEHSINDDSSIGLSQSRVYRSGVGASSKFDTSLTNGVSFVAGHLEFCVAALPLEQLLTIRAFSAARSCNLPELKAAIEYAGPFHCSDGAESTQNSVVSEATQECVDINSEYSSPFYGDESHFERLHRLPRSSMQLLQPSVPYSPISPINMHVSTSQLQCHKLLLHIAIGNKDSEMVKFLLEKGADPNRCSGQLSQSALHLAAHLDLDEIMVELLKYGGDVEIRDSYLHQPLALATDYEIRKLLLGAVMLCSAAEAGDHDEVDRLLSSTQISPNARGLRHKNALHLASAKGHIKVVKSLLLSNVNVNAKGGSRQRTPLHYASLNGNVDIAQLLLSAGTNEFSRDSGGYTPLNLSFGGEMCKLLHKQPLSLCLAVQSRDLSEVKRILAASDNLKEKAGIVDQRNELSHAPLHLACATGNIAIVRALVSYGANLNLHGGSDGWTPLFYAAMAGNDVVVEFLLSVGASTEEVDDYGNTVQETVDKAVVNIKESLSRLERKGRAGSLIEEVSLHTLEPASMTRQESASCCSIEFEKEWLEHRYDALKRVSQLLISGAEKLLIALEVKDLNSFKQLLSSSLVDANVYVDKHNPVPVLTRACEDGLYDFVKVLLEHGAIISENGPVTQIPLMIAATNGYCDVIQLLVDKGANINVQSTDTTQSTPLHEAASANSLDVVEYLLELGADISAKNSSGEVPFDCSTSVEVRKLLASGANRLLVAASEGDKEMILKLVKEEKISPSHEFQHGITALHEACESGHINATQMLIDLGADVNKQIHSSQMSPLHIASRNNCIEISKVLIKAGAKLDAKDSDGKVPFEVACTNQMRRVLVEARSVVVYPIPGIPGNQENSSSEKCCMICMVNSINTIVLPCGHQAFCTTCVARITACALDRQTIREVITIYK